MADHQQPTVRKMATIARTLRPSSMSSSFQIADGCDLRSKLLRDVVATFGWGNENHPPILILEMEGHGEHLSCKVFIGPKVKEKIGDPIIVQNGRDMKLVKRLFLIIGPIAFGAILVIYAMSSFLILDETKIFLAIGVISIVMGVGMIFYIDPKEYTKPNRYASETVTEDKPTDRDLDGVNRNMVEIANSGLPLDHQKFGGSGSRYFSGGDPRLNPPLDRK